jgi:hypothetical protein
LVSRASNPVHCLRSAVQLLACTVSVLAVLHSASTSAQAAGAVTQADLEAVYLYNFGKFVTWPPEQAATSAPFVICTLGNEEFRGALESVAASGTLQGRKIVVRHLASIAAVEGCQILFLARSEAAQLSKDLNAVREKPILTVSDDSTFLDHGGMVQFVVQDKRVRFAVNLQPALQARLAVSSELLKVAIFVHGRPAEEAK